MKNWYVVNRGRVLMTPVSSGLRDPREDRDSYYFFGNKGDFFNDKIGAEPVDFATKQEAQSFANEFGGFPATFIPRRKK